MRGKFQPRPPGKGVRLIALFALFAWLLSGCIPTVNTNITSYETTVDAVSELLRPIRFDDSDGTERVFEAATLLTLLPHLSMEPGYTLNYVYMDYSVGGNPILYAEPSGQSAESIEADRAETLMHYPSSRFWYLDHVRTDDTPEGYFEFVVLRTMGDQFYLNWHSAYNDETVVCSHKALDRLRSSIDDHGFGVPPLSKVRQRARHFDLAPVIVMGEESVSVSIVVFTKWGGLLRRTCVIARPYPHRLLDVQTETLVEYDCGTVI